MKWTEIAAYYRRLFVESGCTQAQIAALGQVPGGQTTISRIVTDRYPEGPRVETFLAALRGLGVTPAAFWEGLEAAARLDGPRVAVPIDHVARLDRLEGYLGDVLDLLLAVATVTTSGGLDHGADPAIAKRLIDTLFADVDRLRTVRTAINPRRSA